MMRVKICGMKYNVKEVAEMQPDYLGFIFWEPSSRYFEGNIPELPPGIRKVGVFVDAALDYVQEKINTYGLSAVQLHGRETPDYCHKLKNIFENKNEPSGLIDLPVIDLTIIKVFSIKDRFDFKVLEPYEEVCDYYLFDTKGKLPGGNGYAFDWSVLKAYPSTKPYFLSGGIGLENSNQVNDFLQRSESKYCYAIDVNSKFEEKPGLKDIKKIKKFANNLKESS